MNLSELGVTANKEKQFNRKGIYDTEDLLKYLPRKYNDFTTLTGFLPEDQTSVLIVRLEELREYRRNTYVLNAKCKEKNTGKYVTITWFNQKWLRRKLTPAIGKDILVAGKAIHNRTYDNYQIMSPEIFETDISKGLAVYPVYSKIPGMSNDYLTEHLQLAMKQTTAQETLPSDIVFREKQDDMWTALNHLHFPKSMQEVERGRDRVLFDDLVYFALHCEAGKREVSLGSQYNIKSLGLMNKMMAALPYQLTADQSAAVTDMIEAAKKGRRLNALVQGDVGCGKTIVAMLTMAAFAGSGYQSVLMAPTQVLARQHYEDAKALFEPLGVNVVLVGGTEKIKKKDRDLLLKDIADGTAQIIVGTHAAFSKDVAYKKLALTVTDEEHKFGVAQRAALVAKAAEGVHSITMSATPIPRSLAMVVYGDTIQLYTIRTMPAGRKPVMTGIAKSRNHIYRFLLKQKKEGRQAYIVCPMIDTNEDMDGVKSVEEISREYRAALEPYGVTFETLTGRNTKEETEDIIGRFKAGEVDVLIATTVIEVGVNVPNATVMVITNAERFGLSGLHQLRGRVGRGSYQSYCVLESDARDGEAKERLDAMCRTTDGFQIAEEDLRIRGAGDFIGTKQSGENKYISLMLAFPDRFERAKAIANELLDRGENCCQMVQEVVMERM